MLIAKKSIRMTFPNSVWLKLKIINIEKHNEFFTIQSSYGTICDNYSINSLNKLYNRMSKLEKLFYET